MQTMRRKYKPQGLKRKPRNESELCIEGGIFINSKRVTQFTRYTVKIMNHNLCVLQQYIKIFELLKLYTSIPYSYFLKFTFVYIRSHTDLKTNTPRNILSICLIFFFDNMFIEFVGLIFQQITSIKMCTSCALRLVDFFLYFCEVKFIQNFV